MCQRLQLPHWGGVAKLRSTNLSRHEFVLWSLQSTSLMQWVCMNCVVLSPFGPFLHRRAVDHPVFPLRTNYSFLFCAVRASTAVLRYAVCFPFFWSLPGVVQRSGLYFEVPKVFEIVSSFGFPNITVHMCLIFFIFVNPYFPRCQFLRTLELYVLASPDLVLCPVWLAYVPLSIQNTKKGLQKAVWARLPSSEIRTWAFLAETGLGQRYYGKATRKGKTSRSPPQSAVHKLFGQPAATLIIHFCDQDSEFSPIVVRIPIPSIPIWLRPLRLISEDRTDGSK